jgi:hypothetical protein
MKRAFVILTLLIAFNFTAPNSQTLIITIRHQIEFAQEDKSRDLTDNELLKNKGVLFMWYQLLALRIYAVNASFGFNTS